MVLYTEVDMNTKVKKTDPPVPTAFSNYLNAAMKQRGWNPSQFAVRCGFGPSQMSKLLSGETKEPGISTLERLASALEIPLRVLVEQLGFKVDDPQQASGDSIIDKQVARLAETDPEYRKLWDDLNRLDPDDRSAVRAYMQGRISRKVQGD